ncbi:MAG: Trp family transcriptional regulator [Verrucomicrobiota bacterium]
MQDNVLNLLTQIFQAARTPEEIRALLDGLLTPQELDEIGHRWRLLCRLEEGWTQREIARDLGVSLGKIARGSRLLKYGSPEFRELVERIRSEIDDKESSC